MRVWNVVRSSTDISSKYNQELIGTESGLVGYWKLNNTFQDATSNANNLTPNNSPYFSVSLPFDRHTTSIRKSAPETISAQTTTLQNDDVLMLSLEANKSYIVDGLVLATSSQALSDIKLQVSATSASALHIAYFAADSTHATGGVLVGSTAVSNGIPVTGIASPLQLSGTVVMGSAGNLVLRWAENSSNANALTVMEGSYLRAQEIVQ